MTRKNFLIRLQLEKKPTTFFLTPLFLIVFTFSFYIHPTFAQTCALNLLAPSGSQSFTASSAPGALF